MISSSIRRKMVFFSILFILLPLKLNAENNLTGEYYVKAAYIYNFAKFIEWPETANTPDAPLTLCILGQNPFGSTLQTIQNKNVRGRTLKIEYTNDLQDIKNCHILFISSSEEGNLQKILSFIKDQPILSVSDMVNFSERGGIIHLVRTDNTIRFRINDDAAKRSHLKISSQLLKLADIVKGNP